MRFDIRPAGRKHHPLLKELHDVCFSDEAPMPNFSNDWWWIAWDKSFGAAAFAGLSRTLRDPSEMGYLKRVGVLPDWRGLGLQLRLIRVRERKARKEGMTFLITDTTEGTVKGSADATRNNLIEAGYKIFTPPNPWAFKDSIYWIKSLE